ncbi:MAG: hypothetical protein ABIP64_02605 [Burkholderiales bacterium]
MNRNGEAGSIVHWVRIFLAGLSLVLVAALVLGAMAQDVLAAEPAPGSYKVVAGKVDRGTYLGWKVFHTNCYGCSRR